MAADYKIELNKYLPYLKDFTLDYKYLKDNVGQGVQVWLFNKDYNLSRKKEYVQEAFDSKRINLEMIKAEMVLKVFEDFQKAVEQGKIQKPKSTLDEILDKINEIFTKARSTH